MSRLSKDEAPFWEIQRGYGPVMDTIAREKFNRVKINRRYRIGVLQDELFRLEYSKETDYSSRIKELKEQLFELGATALRPKSKSELDSYSPSHDLTRVRVQGSDGNGNRRVGHNNISSK